MIDAARRRLELWDVSAEEIAALEQRQTPLDYVPIAAPRSGVVVSTSVVEGSSRPAGTTLMRIADLSEVWVEAQVYEADLAMVSVGMPATVTLPYLPGQRFEGEIDYVYPFLDAASRTTRVRMSLDNTDGVLKPDMYAEILLAADFGERLVVPTEAVIFAGETRVVFENLGGGRLAPRRIQTGLRNAGYIEVLDGLEAGAQIVTSGTFLIAAESRLSSGLEQW
jgi:Cu(I)/Ag(I) efflux system membrane fusion protein